MNDQTAQQVAPIQVYDPKEKQGETEKFGTCLCCGEEANTHGMCFKCAQENCSKSLTRECKRTGAKDPLNFAVLEEEDFLDLIVPVP